jgi:hypothetical protein
LEEVGGKLRVFAISKHVVEFKGAMQMLVGILREAEFPKDGASIVQVDRVGLVMVGLAGMRLGRHLSEFGQGEIGIALFDFH